MKHPLLVPVELRVMLAGSRERETMLADIAPHYERLASDSLFGDDITNDNLVMMSEHPGAHLHWLMPDALLHGIQDENGDLEFPILPNRWIVTRIWTEEDQIRRRIWMIQSDKISFDSDGIRTVEGMEKTPIPCLVYNDAERIWEPAGKNGSFYARLGDAQIYGEEEEPQQTLDRLTAVGMGDHMFAALYPLCRTVFGFYDAMEEGEGVYTYQVCGFYQNPTEDPLSDPAHLEETASEFGWTWDKDAGTPDGILCHGAVYGVSWKGKEKQYIDVSAVQAEVAVANTSAEALAAFFQKKLPHITGLERMLNALQCGILEELDSEDLDDGLIDLEDKLHEREFELLRAGENDQGRSSLSEIRRKRKDCGEEVYLYWHKYMKSRNSPFGSDEAEQFREKLEKCLDDWEKLKSQEEEEERKLEDLKKDMEILPAPEDPFYQPGPPVVMIADTGTVRTYRHGFQSEKDGTLPCRLYPVGKLEIPWEMRTLTVDAEDLLRQMDQAMRPVPEMVERLCCETLLLDQNAALFLASAALRKTGETGDEKERQELASQILNLQKAVKGAPFDISRQSWRQPWNPIVLDWQACLVPARKDARREDTFRHFKLGTIDLEPEDQEFGGKALPLGGQTFLTPHAGFVLGEALKKLLECYDPSSKEYQEVQEFAGEVQERQILSQKLTGFQETLQGLKYRAFLPVLVGDMKEETELASRVEKVMEDVYPVSEQGLDNDAYLPLRGGEFRLESLRLIDEFGQCRQMVMPEKVIIAESLENQETQSAVLPPRFPGGLRVKFDWICEDGGFHKALDQNTTPVCGFVLGNILEQNLQIYDQEGVFLGWLQDTDRGAQWRPRPGELGRLTQEMPEGMLGAFVEKVLTWDRTLFAKLLKQIDTFFTEKPVLNGAPETFHLAGGCFALAAARCSVEEWGLRKKFWGGTEVKENGYEKAAFKLRVGDPRRNKDGVIGFFSMDADGKLDLFAPGGEELTLSLEDSEQMLFMLLDPCRKVTIRTGFLPVYEVGLPAELYRNQAERLKLCLSMWPVLTDVEGAGVMIQEKYSILDDGKGEVEDDR